MKKPFLTLILLGVFFFSSGAGKHPAFEDGRASDCARMARATTLKLAELSNTNPNDPDVFEAWISLYNELYEGCYYSN